MTRIQKSHSMAGEIPTYNTEKAVNNLYGKIDYTVIHALNLQ